MQFKKTKWTTETRISDLNPDFRCGAEAVYLYPVETASGSVCRWGRGTDWDLIVRGRRWWSWVRLPGGPAGTGTARCGSRPGRCTAARSPGRPAIPTPLSLAETVRLTGTARRTPTARFWSCSPGNTIQTQSPYSPTEVLAKLTAARSS